MPTAMNVFAELVLSFNGEEVEIHAEGDRITVLFASLPQGIRSVRRLLDMKESIERLQRIHSGLNHFGLSLYLKAGRVHAPVLGANAPQKIVPALINVLRKFSAAKASVGKTPK